MIKLISNNCPKCIILKDKLKEKNIEFIEEDNIEILKSNGLRGYPALIVDGVVMDYLKSIQWINKKQIGVQL